MDILVVGAGPSGLMMAGELARHGVTCRIVDRNDGPAKESRALAVQARTLQIFESVGLADELLKRGVPMSYGHVVVDGTEIAELDFTKIPGKYNFILACPQCETEGVLLERLRLKDVQVERNCEVTGLTRDKDCVEVEFAGGRKAKFDYVVGCDGAGSIVRKSLGIDFEGDEVPQGFLLADVVLNWDRPEGMYLLVSEAGFLAVFPLPEGRTRIIATAPPEETGPIELAEIERVFSDRSPYEGKISDVAWSSRFLIHERIVSLMRDGRCFLVGDAAHLHSPAGGQGMNTGLQDAHNLAWKLALAAKGYPSTKLLDSYNDERFPVDEHVVNLTRGLMHNMAFGGSVAKWIRDHVAPHVIGIPMVHRKLMETVSEQSVGYGQSPIVGLRAGHWAEDVTLPDGARHLVTGRDATKYAAAHPDLCVAHDSDEEVRMIRPDGYVGAVGDESVNRYFDLLRLPEKPVDV